MTLQQKTLQQIMYKLTVTEHSLLIPTVHWLPLVACFENMKTRSWVLSSQNGTGRTLINVLRKVTYGMIGTVARNGREEMSIVLLYSKSETTGQNRLYPRQIITCCWSTLDYRVGDVTDYQQSVYNLSSSVTELSGNVISFLWWQFPRLSGVLDSHREGS